MDLLWWWFGLWFELVVWDRLVETGLGMSCVGFWCADLCYDIALFRCFWFGDFRVFVVVMSRFECVTVRFGGCVYLGFE